jgi:hypothetical protein
LADPQNQSRLGNAFSARFSIFLCSSESYLELADHIDLMRLQPGFSFFFSFHLIFKTAILMIVSHPRQPQFLPAWNRAVKTWKLFHQFLFYLDDPILLLESPTQLPQSHWTLDVFIFPEKLVTDVDLTPSQFGDLVQGKVFGVGPQEDAPPGPFSLEQLAETFKLLGLDRHLLIEQLLTDYPSNLLSNRPGLSCFYLHDIILLTLSCIDFPITKEILLFDAWIGCKELLWTCFRDPRMKYFAWISFDQSKCTILFFVFIFSLCKFLPLKLWEDSPDIISKLADGIHFFSGTLLMLKTIFLMILKKVKPFILPFVN